jgi:hypothetical protein
MDLKVEYLPANWEQSFLGVAFHGIEGTNYDAVYFRPFNFCAEDPVRRSHAASAILLIERI